MKISLACGNKTVDVLRLDVNWVQSFPFVLCTMALKSLSVHYTKIINDDRVSIDFDIVRKEDREKEVHSLLHQWVLLEK